MTSKGVDINVFYRSRVIVQAQGLCSENGARSGLPDLGTHLASASNNFCSPPTYMIWTWLVQPVYILFPPCGNERRSMTPRTSILLGRTRRNPKTRDRARLAGRKQLACAHELGEGAR